MKIAVVGSINVDYTLKTNELPKLGETLTATYYNSNPGGKGANQAVAAARLGADVSMIGCIGNDIVGQRLRDSLKNEGIDVDNVVAAEAATGNAFITIDDKGDNTIIVYPGANAQLDCEMINRSRETIMKSNMLMTQLEVPIESIERAMEIAKENNVKVLLNPAPVKELPEKIYSLIDIITPNETELERLTGEATIRDGAKKLLDKGVGAVIVTLGEKGSYYLDDKSEFFAKPFKIEAKDTTAAGDSFNGAVAIQLLGGKNIEEGLLYANAAGALAATKLGAQDSIPYTRDVESFIENE